MITWANLRASAALWLMLPVLVYVSLYIGDAASPVPSRYGVEAGELAAYAVAVVVPAPAGAAARGGGRPPLLGGPGAPAPPRGVRQLPRAPPPPLPPLGGLVLGAPVLAYAP